jgi:hypothetical protein
MVWPVVVLAPLVLGLTYLGVLLLADTIRLRVSSDGIVANGRRHRVAFAWPDVSDVGVAHCNGHEWLTVWLNPGVSSPPEKFMYPAWSDQVGAVLIGRLDLGHTTAPEWRSTVHRYAPDKWREPAR